MSLRYAPTQCRFRITECRFSIIRRLDRTLLLITPFVDEKGHAGLPCARNLWCSYLHPSMTLIDQLATTLADRYRLDRELGSGGMATVYLAHDVRHDRKVAIKILKPELAAVIGGARFLAEIKTTANLQHPHILPLHDSGEVAGTVFYVMPFVDGESLRDRLDREKQLPIPVALRIATEVADALHYAHTHGTG